MSDIKIPSEFAGNKSQPQKKHWQPRKMGLTNKQKISLCLCLIFIPLFVYIILPILARRHFCNYLQLPPEVFLSEPKTFGLIRQNSTPIGPSYNLTINGFEFNIPNHYTPSNISENSIDLTYSSNPNARLIHIYTDIDDKNFNFTSFGISRWFMPSNPAVYMNIILHATWHPIRLMYKSQFYANEGINTQIYETYLPNDYRAYIYALPGQNGYTSRIYNAYGAGFIEFSIKDSVNRPSLQEWVNYASYIKTFKKTSDVPKKDAKTEYNLDDLIILSQKGQNESNVLSICLSEYFRTKSPEWIIPVAYIMKNREYYIDLNDLYNQFAEKFPQNSTEKAQWDSIIEEAVNKIVHIEIDPTDRVRELNIFCKNLTELEIEDIIVEITIVNHLGKSRSFKSSLTKEVGNILPELEKNIHIRPPDDMNLTNAQKISCKVDKIHFLR